MIIFFAILAAVVAIAAIVFTIRLAPGRTENVPRGGQRSEGQGEELTPRSLPPDFHQRDIHRCWRVGPL